ncbi:SRPBCC domain-containing protein [Georgenia sp. AZ-5]|uniref:SRPBCC domain-containing protein n=1 Tax=Georgenia sp. AZ-5 TaxID=3367526 RepID=UPI0037540A6C
MSTTGPATSAAPSVPLVKTVTVPVGVDRAFELFTEEMSRWWPLVTHSVGEAQATGVTLEGRLGGRIVETLADGSTSVWGTVTAWEPPGVVAFTWHPGRGADEATAVEMHFTEADGGTFVRLSHSGWAARDDAGSAWRSYDTGWERVLARYARLASGAAG